MEQPTINDLKAEVYDRFSMIEQHQISIQKLQAEINEINKQIAERVQGDKMKVSQNGQLSEAMP